MNGKQQQLTFEKGITNVPSDAICSDNALQESVGLVYTNGEHRVIQNPVDVITSYAAEPTVTSWSPTSMPVFLYVHKVADRDIYIGYGNASNTGATVQNELIYGIVQNKVFYLWGILGLTYTNTMQVTSVGKTLVVNDGTEIKYFLWKPEANQYSTLGIIPEPKIKFGVVPGIYGTLGNTYKSSTLSADGILEVKNNQPSIITNNSTAQESYNDLVLGLYSRCLKSVKHDNCFAEPFSVRYALEMYDGSYIYQSAPQMIFPAVTCNCSADLLDSGKVRMIVYAYYLALKAEYDYSEWSDIIKRVVVFASDGENLYDTTGDQSVTPAASLQSGGTLCADSISMSGGQSAYNTTTGKIVVSPIVDNSRKYGQIYIRESTTGTLRPFLPLRSRSYLKILDGLASNSVYYKLFTLDLVKSGSWESASRYMEEHVVENLVTQEQMTDDYYSHTSKGAKNIFSYNGRLILGNVLRGFFDGFGEFIGYDNNNQYSYNIVVYVKTPSGVRTVHKQVDTYEKMGLYFFYPDPRAYKADIFLLSGASWRLYKELDLKEHPGLNGAYYIEQPIVSETEPSTSSSTEPPENYDSTPEKLGSQVWTSEVNNPFLFKAEGNMTVGNGDITGLSSITQALSQGQFGQYPLIIFTDEGIWAASTGSTGLFTAAHPMSREVCNSPKSITQTDGAVFFASAKGLMVVVGSQVKCVSEQLSGRADGDNISGTSFADFLGSAFIAYDYRDSLLWLFNPSTGFEEYCYIYSIKSGTFSKYYFNNAIEHVVNNYPDYLLQDHNHKVYSLLRRPNINSDTGTYAATLKSRPLKLEDALALKSLMQLRHIYDFHAVVPGASAPGLSLRIFASNTLQRPAENWPELHSLRGIPWKYYRLEYSFSNLSATDTFAGTMLITQERRTNKLR